MGEKRQSQHFLRLPFRVVWSLQEKCEGSPGLSTHHPARSPRVPGGPQGAERGGLFLYREPALAEQKHLPGRRVPCVGGVMTCWGAAFRVREAAKPWQSRSAPRRLCAVGSKCSRGRGRAKAQLMTRSSCLQTPRWHSSLSLESKRSFLIQDFPFHI